MLTKVAREYDRLFGRLSMWILWVPFVLVLLSGNAWADVFVVDATSNQIAGDYIPSVGGRHYNCNSYPFNGGCEQFFNRTGGLPVLHGEFEFASGIVPINQNATLPCQVSLIDPSYCWNIPQFFAADDGSLLAQAGSGSGGRSHLRRGRRSVGLDVCGMRS